MWVYSPVKKLKGVHDSLRIHTTLIQKIKYYRMKKVLIAAFALALTYNAFSQVHISNFRNLEFESSNKNTSANEMPMSPYKDGSIAFFRNDTAFAFYSDSQFEIDSLILCPELMGLGIEGTFAYDQAGKKLYFSKKGEDGNELYEASLVESKWENVNKLKIKGVMPFKKQPVGSSLAAARWVYMEGGTTGFYNPSLSMNGSRIYFSGTFKAGKGERDLWYIDKEEDDLWSYPRSAGDNINTEYNDDYALVIGDTMMLFASSRPGGYQDMDIYIAHRSLTDTVWGVAQNLGEKINSASKDYNMVINDKSVYFISDRAGGKGGADIYRPAMPEPDQESQLISEMPLVEPKDFQWVLFHFDFDKSKLKEEYLNQLDEMAQSMKEFPNARFEIIGHTDRRGSDAYNMGLSQRRADSIKELLVQRGIDADKLVTVAKGESEPLITNPKNEADHEQNRRVEIKIIKQ
jgi:outer membrane protein OmpA-like peptidoglycan-associated protein